MDFNIKKYYGKQLKGSPNLQISKLKKRMDDTKKIRRRSNQSVVRRKLFENEPEELGISTFTSVTPTSDVPGMNQANLDDKDKPNKQLMEEIEEGEVLSDTEEVIIKPTLEEIFGHISAMKIFLMFENDEWNKRFCSKLEKLERNLLAMKEKKK